jgi:hypothetical protein
MERAALWLGAGSGSLGRLAGVRRKHLVVVRGMVIDALRAKALARNATDFRFGRGRGAQRCFGMVKQDILILALSGSRLHGRVPLPETQMSAVFSR